MTSLAIDRGSCFSESESSLVEQIAISIRDGDLDTLRQVLSTEYVDCNVLLEGGLTPLYVAAELGERECVTLLLERRADPSLLCGFEKLTPLHAAAEKGHTLVIQTLLNEPSVNRDALSGNGSTPLHLAARGQTLGAYDLLIREGASRSVINRDGLTPEAIAQRIHPNRFSTEPSSSTWAWALGGIGLATTATLVGLYYWSQRKEAPPALSAPPVSQPPAAPPAAPPKKSGHKHKHKHR